MTRKREPVAEIGDEDYRIVRYTHDIDLATQLMRAHLKVYYGCPRDGEDDGCPILAPVGDCPHEWERVGKPEQVYARIQHALPNSYAAAEGWTYAYHEYEKPGRGAFPAVVFR